MRAFDVVVIVAIWGGLGAVAGPKALKAWREPKLPPGMNEDRYFDTQQAGIIFYPGTTNLHLDTTTCSLPANSVIPTGK